VTWDVSRDNLAEDPTLVCRLVLDWWLDLIVSDRPPRIDVYLSTGQDVTEWRKELWLEIGCPTIEQARWGLDDIEEHWPKALGTYPVLAERVMEQLL
jgi:hypothetical protein